jgi:hypothetical protein
MPTPQTVVRACHPRNNPETTKNYCNLGQRSIVAYVDRFTGPPL